MLIAITMHKSYMLINPYKYFLQADICHNHSSKLASTSSCFTVHVNHDIFEKIQGVYLTFSNVGDTVIAMVYLAC